jgi:hypothetical protein
MRQSTIEFIAIVKDYTNEKPCNNCIRSYTQVYKVNNNVDIDDHIVTKLFTMYATRIYGTKAINAARRRVENIGDKESLHRIRERQKQYRLKHLEKNGKLQNVKLIEKNISKVTGIKTTSFVVTKCRQRKTCKTIEEARLFRDSILLKSEKKKKVIQIKGKAERGIYTNTNPETGYVSFSVYFNGKFKSFKTLEETQQFKQGILNGNNTLTA